jgi:hypothetical protein
MLGPTPDPFWIDATEGSDPPLTPPGRGWLRSTPILLTHHDAGPFPSWEGQGWVVEARANFLLGGAGVKELFLLIHGPISWMQQFEVIYKNFQYLKDPVGIEKNLLISEMQHSDPQCFQGILFFLVFLFYLLQFMSDPVQFDGQQEVGTIEIDDEVANGFLPVEVIAFQLFPFELFPHKNLRAGGVVAQFSGVLLEMSAVGEYGTVWHRNGVLR